ncbi:putative Mannosyltransferase [Phytophthora infestans]|uniref:Putative Mannosyltransferase n=1 Tax=Phytophthora infestans TaxID=4787 RepID=A0A833S2D8_PHYIN|nr:putative Mannosyltransferase [Phytophthora infestans]
MNNVTILEPLRRLARLEDNITFQEITDPRAKRFVAKIHAIYYSSFDRVLFLDADNVPVRDPSFLFTSPEFVKTGAIFWPDFWHPDSTIFGLDENSLLWELMDMPFVDMFEQESGQLVVDRRRHAAPLALVRFYALHRPNLFSSLRLLWGDKDLFRLAWLKLEIPFTMIQTPPAMAGIIYGFLLRSDFCGLTMVQHDADGGILFMHRNQHKLTGKSTEKAVDTSRIEDDPEENYADPAIWTHILRFRTEASRRNYAIQMFRLDLDFEANKKCFGRRDVYRNPNFYVQEITTFSFSGLETPLRRFALESTRFSSGI